MKPFFSIIIPTLNEEKYLPKLLGCIKGQVFNKLEVIIVDGESCDTTIQVAKKWKRQLQEAKIALQIIKSTRKSVSFQRNLGAKEAKGSYLVFFDADVLFKKDFLKRIYDYIGRTKAVFVTTWLIPDSNNLFDRLGIFIWNLLVVLASRTDKVLISGHNIVIARKTFWQVGGFNPKIVHAEDHSFAQAAKRQGVRLSIIKDLNQVVSLRRLRREGRAKMLLKYARSLLFTLFRGPITKDLFDYPMGGGKNLQ